MTLDDMTLSISYGTHANPETGKLSGQIAARIVCASSDLYLDDLQTLIATATSLITTRATDVGITVEYDMMTFDVSTETDRCGDYVGTEYTISAPIWRMASDEELTKARAYKDAYDRKMRQHEWQELTRERAYLTQTLEQMSDEVRQSLIAERDAIDAKLAAIGVV